MGLFDAFSTAPANNAAGAQIGAINSGLSQLIPQYNAGQAALTSNVGNANNALTTNYTAGLVPYLNNVLTANKGTAALGNALGLNGTAGNNSALTTLQNTPGYQFQLQQGENAVEANQAKNGQLNSGNTDVALNNYAQGLAGTTYNNYVSQLQNYLPYSTSSAQGVLGGYGSLGSNLSSNYTGLGQGLNQSDQSIGNAIYGANASIGNAQANADLAGYNASANGINALIGGAGAVAKLLPFLPSDKRVKEDIEQVGELFDGQPVVRYRYKGDLAHQLGLIAQEVETEHPEAVAEFGGVKHVNYRAATDFAADLGRFMKEAA